MLSFYDEYLLLGNNNGIANGCCENPTIDFKSGMRSDDDDANGKSELFSSPSIFCVLVASSK
jgi:hypothetical protein